MQAALATVNICLQMFDVHRTFLFQSTLLLTLDEQIAKFTSYAVVVLKSKR